MNATALVALASLLGSTLAPLTPAAPAPAPAPEVQRWAAPSEVALAEAYNRLYGTRFDTTGFEGLKSLLAIEGRPIFC